MMDSSHPARIADWPVFSYPFRIFFLSLSILALVSIPLWLLVLFGTVNLPLALPGILWHQHEMLFGFLSAAIAGFLLTAVCVWTQTERTHGRALMLLWLVWLSGRLLLLLGGALPDWLVQGVNLAFLPLVMWDAGRRIWAARQMRQLMILVVLGLLWLMQMGLVLLQEPRFTTGALVMAVALMMVIGGRITPAFSGAWLRQQGQSSDVIRTLPWLEKATLGSLLLLLPTMLLEWQFAQVLLAIAAAIACGLRLWFWRGWLVRREPLLWILHLSLLWIPVGLLLLAGSLLEFWSGSAWRHAIGVGAAGGLILGVISRVTLGHTGRPLQLPKGMVAAFVLLHLGAVIRVLTALEFIPWHPGLGSSTLCWMLAFGLYLLRYTHMLCSPRADGRTG